MSIIKKIAGGIFLLALLVPMVGCDDSYAGTREQKIIGFFKKLKPGTDSDYAVVKIGATGIPDPIIVIYGFVSNASACQEIVDFYNRTENGAVAAKYHCEALN